jgi:hypothetical protein
VIAPRVAIALALVVAPTIPAARPVGDGLPRWPEATGTLDSAATVRATESLDLAIRELPAGERRNEVLYLRGLLRLEPQASYDEEAARRDLLAAAAGGWAPARYALAWLLEQQGETTRAAEGFGRLLVDAPHSIAGAHARAGLGRLLLRAGQFGQAAASFDEAIEGGADPSLGVEVLRELAVRSLLREAGVGRAPLAAPVHTGIRPVTSFAPTGSGGAMISDGKHGIVVELDQDGAPIREWRLEDPQLLAVDLRGRRYAVAAGKLQRLHDGGHGEPRASLGDYAPLAGLVADGAGGFWILERRGRRVGRIDPGATEPRPIWSNDDVQLTALAWDGRRLVGADRKTRSLVVLDGGSSARSLVQLPELRPIALAADAAGRIAVLDGKSGTVTFVAAGGGIESGVFAWADMPRPAAVGFGPEGELHLCDADGGWVVFR